MNFELNRLIDYSDEAILEEIRRVAQLLKVKPLSQKKFNEVARVHSSTIQGRFGTWDAALLKAGLDRSYINYKRKISKEEIIAELNRVSSIIGSKSFTREQFFQHSFISSEKSYVREFGSFKKAIEAAGFKVVPLGKRYTDEECFENLLNLWTYYGRQPHYSEINKSPSKVGPKAYMRRWGTWRKALLAFLERIRKDLSDQAKEENVVKDETKKQIDKKIKIPESNRREIRLGLRYEILKRDSFKCVLCGDSPAFNHSCTLEVDHIIPWSKDGLTVKENLRTLCERCNSGKGVKN